MRTLMWFRADLRTHDNPALHHAARDSEAGVIAVFIICAEQWAMHDWAPIKVDFILRHLAVLSHALKKLNISLLIIEESTFAGVPARLLHLAQEHQCDTLHFNDEYELNESRRDEAVINLFQQRGLRARSFLDQCLAQPGEVRTGEGRYFTVFSPFKRALYTYLTHNGGIEVLPEPKPQKPLGHSSTPVPTSVVGFDSHFTAELWPAGEGVAMSRLKRFVASSISHYKSRRDFPAINGTSVLSPYLAVGSITHRQSVAAALAANGGHYDKGDDGTVHWISEIAWREFYRHILVGFPRVCMHRAFKPSTEHIRWSNNEAHFQAWCEGKTGVPIVDAGMRQLQTTGWMHNRVRMIVAMYLTKDLFIDWRKGEQHFMRHLIDGDLASNNGGWQWSASTGTDAAPYFRIFNSITQSRKFDPEGNYIRTYVPELADLDGGSEGDGPVHDPSEIPLLLRNRLDYPATLVDRASVKDRVMKAFQSLPSK